jgi:hypothetical protein
MPAVLLQPASGNTYPYVVRLLHAARTRRILLLPAGHTHRIVASCGGTRRTQLPSCSRRPQQVIATGGLCHKSQYSSIRFYD